MSAVPEGWFFDKGDASVGIFGEEWVHEDCPVVQGPGNGDLMGVEHEDKVVGALGYSGMIQVVHHLTCKDCGQEAVFDTEEFAGPTEEEAA